MLSLRGAVAAEKISFNRDVRPILSDNCFHCHGPGEKDRKGGLRLDVSEAALKGGESGAAFVPGKPQESELIIRILSHDPDELMPPKKSNKALQPEQIETLRRWIAEGAEYQGHWAFIKPERPVVPTISDCGLRSGSPTDRPPLVPGAAASADWPSGVRPEDWSANPIDGFVLQRMTKAGLKPSQPAPPETFCRLYLDLTGIPPTPAEVDAFLQSEIRNPQFPTSSTVCSPPRVTVKRWRSSGSTSRVTRTATASRPTPRAPCGRGATGSSARSMPTSRSINSPSSNSPEIFCPSRRATRSSPSAHRAGVGQSRLGKVLRHRPREKHREPRLAV